MGNVTFWIFTGWKIIPCPRTIIFNNCEQKNLLGDIFNAGDNIDDQEDYGFRGSFFKIAPTVIYDYTKNIFLNMHLEDLIPQRNIENIEKKSDEGNRINMIHENLSDKRNQIGKNDEDRSTDDIEVLKLVILCSKRDI